jgi:hypothetical protein
MPRLELDHRLQHGGNDLLLLLLLLDACNQEWGQSRRHELLLQQLLLLNICPLSLSQLREVGMVLPILTFLPVSTPLPNVFPRRLHTHIRPKPRDPHKTILEQGASACTPRAASRKFPSRAHCGHATVRTRAQARDRKRVSTRKHRHTARPPPS